MDLYPIQKLLQEQRKKYPEKFYSFFSHVTDPSPPIQVKQHKSNRSFNNASPFQDNMPKKYNNSSNNSHKVDASSPEPQISNSSLQLGRKVKSNFGFHGSNMITGPKPPKYSLQLEVHSTRDKINREASLKTEGDLQTESGPHATLFSHRIVRPSKVKDVNLYSSPQVTSNNEAPSAQSLETPQAKSLFITADPRKNQRKAQMYSIMRTEPDSTHKGDSSQAITSEKGILGGLERIYYQDLDAGKEMGLIKMDQDKILTSPYTFKSAKNANLKKEDSRIDALLKSYRNSKNEDSDFYRNYNPYHGRELSLESKGLGSGKNSKLYELGAKAGILKNIKTLDEEMKITHQPSPSLTQPSSEIDSRREIQLPAIKSSLINSKTRKELRISNIYQSNRS